MNWKIEVVLDKNRWNPGWLTLTVDGAEALNAICIGIADRQDAASHGNPTADMLKPYGDTPTGLYSACWEALDPAEFAPHSYGVSGCIALTPQSGACMSAAKNGRINLLIHSGDPGFDPNRFGGLRPTNGCVRVGAEAMAKISETVQGAGTVEVTEV